MMKKKSLLLLSVLAVSAQGLSACRWHYMEGTVNQDRVEVHEGDYSDEQLAADVTSEYLSGLAAHYDRFGDGQLYASVTYDPKSQSATAMQATQKASAISQELRRKGVKDLKVDIMPVNAQGEQMHVLFSYKTYTAKAPENCGRMEGFEDLNQTLDKDYKLGCTVEASIARQIARPKDLLGHEALPADTDAFGSYSTVAPVTYNQKNGELGGESATE